MRARRPGIPRDALPSDKELLLQVVLLAAGFALIQRWSQLVLYLPEASYSSPFLTWATLQHLISTRSGLVGLLPLLGLGFVRRREFALSWSEMDYAQGVRALVLLLVFWGTWAVVTLDYNLFYDQGYGFDRLILFGLAALTVWRPAFAIPFVFLFIAVDHQFDHPFGRQIFSRMIIEVLLLLFGVSILVRAVLKRQDTRAFVVVASALLASYYWFPGYVKLVRGWFWYGQLYLGGFASYANGWLAALAPERVEALLRLGALVDLPGRALTMVAELGALLFFAHRRAPQILLVAWTGLHVGIWLFSGVSFLIWIVVDLAFLALFYLDADRFQELFQPRVAVGAALLMLLSPLWVRAPAVGWFDTQLVYTYRYEAVDDQGSRGAFPADATPLGESWCARDFPYLVQEKALLIRYGKTNDRVLADRVTAAAGSAQAIFDLEQSVGAVYYHEGAAANLDRFIGRTAMAWNRRGSTRSPLGWAAPPRTCLSPRSPPEPVIATGRPIHQIIVHQLTFLFDGRTLQEVRRRPVRTIDVPA